MIVSNSRDEIINNSAYHTTTWIDYDHWTQRSDTIFKHWNMVNSIKKIAGGEYANMNFTYRKVSDIRRALVCHKIVDHSDVVGAALLQLHLHFRLNIWLQGIRQRRPQDGTIIFWVLGFGVSYISELTVHWNLRRHQFQCEPLSGFWWESGAK